MSSAGLVEVAGDLEDDFDSRSDITGFGGHPAGLTVALFLLCGKVRKSKGKVK